MSEYITNLQGAGTARLGGKRGSSRPRGNTRRSAVLGGAALLIAGGALWAMQGGGQAARPPAAPLAHVTVSTPLEASVAPQRSFLGQFSAVDAVELRAQVGGTLTEINFTDGQIVHKGDLLFTIDPRPYQIRLAQAVAQLQSAQAKLTLTQIELSRAQNLHRDNYSTAETVDQRLADQRSAEAAILQAQAAIRDAQLDLDYCHVAAPFTGRISAHRVSIGSLVAGSRAAASPTTLLTTLVSLDPVHLDFDMSEADYLAYTRARQARGAAISDSVTVSMDDEAAGARTGRIDFVDNAVDRGSGTIHARATVPNPDLFIAPGEFARLQLTIGAARQEMLVPDSAVAPDQSNHVVMTVDASGTVVPKIVQVGDLRGSLRTIRSGLQRGDAVIIDGLMRAQPGMKVVADQGAIKG